MPRLDSDDANDMVAYVRVSTEGQEEGTGPDV